VKRFGKAKIFIKGSNEKLMVDYFLMWAQTSITYIPVYKKYEVKIKNGMFNVKEIYN
jgi:hypothetical protein